MPIPIIAVEILSDLACFTVGFILNSIVRHYRNIHKKKEEKLKQFEIELQTFHS